MTDNVTALPKGRSMGPDEDQDAGENREGSGRAARPGAKAGPGTNTGPGKPAGRAPGATDRGGAKAKRADASDAKGPAKADGANANAVPAERSDALLDADITAALESESAGPDAAKPAGGGKPAPEPANQAGAKPAGPRAVPGPNGGANPRPNHRPKAQGKPAEQARVVEIDPPRPAPQNRAVPRPPASPPPTSPPPTSPSPASPASPAPAAPSSAREKRQRHRRARARFGQVTFLLLWLLPTALVAFYYAAVASDQYVVEAQFAVRGVEAPVLPSLNSLGLGALPGSTNESSDSYVISDYIESVQIVEDIRRNEGVDLRQFFARPLIDFVHRIDPAMPIAEFADVWRWRTNVEYNSITGNTTFEVYAFTPEDARRITELVLSQSERVVNDLSSGARDALINTARAEVERTQQRLREASAAVLAFRNAQQIVDPTQVATLEAGILQELEGALVELRTRRRALLAQVSASSPAVRALDPQIAALEAQIAEQRRNIGAGSGEADAGNVAAVVAEYTDLALSEEFARTAYTTALAALETAQADARKQERYLATFVAPSAPDVSLHPKRLLYTLVAAFWFLILWAVVVFVTRSVRDHAI